MLVLDASAALEIFLKTSLGVRGAERVFAAEEKIHAPHLLDVEFVQVLRKLKHAGKLEAAICKTVLEDFHRLPVTRYAHTDFLFRIWELRDSVSAYDAVYIALAESLDAPLFTCDAKLSRSHGHYAKIVLLQ